MDNDHGRGSLALLVLIISIVFACFFAWLVLSSCLGASITRPMRDLWDAAVQASHIDNTLGPHAMRSAGARRRRELGLSEADLDLWEMETLGARRGG